MSALYKSFENTVEKGFSPFPTMFSTLPYRNFIFSVTFILSSANAFHFGWSKILLFGKELTLSEISPPLYMPSSIRLLKTLWEKEKLLITRNFSFSHSVFYPFGDFSATFIEFKLSSANSINLEESKICRLGKCKAITRQCRILMH